MSLSSEEEKMKSEGWRTVEMMEKTHPGGVKLVKEKLEKLEIRTMAELKAFIAGFTDGTKSAIVFWKLEAGKSPIRFLAMELSFLYHDLVEREKLNEMTNSGIRPATNSGLSETKSSEDR